MKVTSVEHVVELDNVRIGGIASELVSSAIEAKDEPFRYLLWLIPVDAVRMFVLVLGDTMACPS